MPRNATRWTVLQKVRSHAYALLPSVSKGFQVLFHSPTGVLFTFPSLYCFTIGRQVVFRLRGWSPRIQSGFHVSRPTLDTAVPSLISSTGLSPAMADYSKAVRLSSTDHVCGPNPRNPRVPGLASSPFARHYLGNHCCFLFLPLLRCFSSRRIPPYDYVFIIR